MIDFKRPARSGFAEVVHARIKQQNSDQHERQPIRTSTTLSDIPSRFAARNVQGFFLPSSLCFSSLTLLDSPQPVMERRPVLSPMRSHLTPKFSSSVRWRFARGVSFG